MLSFILSLFGNVKNLLMGIGGAIAGIWILLLKRKDKVQENVIHSKDNALEVYKAKDDIHKEEQKIQQETQKKLKEEKENVESLPEDEQASAVSDLLNGFFNPDNK